MLSLARAVQDGEVEVGRRVVPRGVPRVSAEELVRDQRRERERQR